MMKIDSKSYLKGEAHEFIVLSKYDTRQFV